MDTRVIVNPHAAGGRVGRRWPALRARLQEAIGLFDTTPTTGPMDASRLAREAARAGYRRVVAVGGDGTLSEVVDGLFPDGEPVAPRIVLGHLSHGTGGDFRRSLGLPRSDEVALGRLRAGRTRLVDVGVLRYTTTDGGRAVRAFLNIASFGLSGAVDERVNRARLPKLLGGTFAFAWASARAALSYRAPRVRICVDGGTPMDHDLAVACVCNGQYAGGGMRFAPNAALDDGLFDVIVIADAGLRRLVTGFGSIYRGRHLDHPNVTALTGRRIDATPLGGEPVLLDVDGEAPGRLPASFEIRPGALRLAV